MQGISFFTFTIKMVTQKNAVAADFYNKYINAVNEEDVVKALKKMQKNLKNF